MKIFEKILKLPVNDFIHALMYAFDKHVCMYVYNIQISFFIFCESNRKVFYMKLLFDNVL
jgi:hypothetical protein